MNILARAIAYVALVGALLATAIALNNRQYPAVETPKSWSTSGLDAELARCKAINPEATADAGCKAAWEANRKRFLQFGKPYQDRLIDDFATTPDLKQNTSGAEVPKRTQQWPATQNSDSTRPPVDIAGPLK
jgi:conjugative transfer region protein TrbK